MSPLVATQRMPSSLRSQIQSGSENRSSVRTAFISSIPESYPPGLASPYRPADGRRRRSSSAAGLAGLVATAELADAGRRVILVDQEPEASLGGQAFWSFGGLFLVDTPEQRRLRHQGLARAGAGRTGWARPASTAPEDEWPRRWAEAYVDFAAGEKRAWLHEQGVRWLPNVGWAERGGYGAIGHGNSVPRFHVTWGTGPGRVEPFVAPRARRRGARARRRCASATASTR